MVARKPKEYDLIINIPPGSTKSTICTIMYPVWCWITDPTQRIITSSYAADLSTDHAVKSRDIIRSEKFQRYFPGIQIKKDEDNKTHYVNTDRGGRRATSTGGTVIGFHAHQIIVDDPVNTKKATSDADRKTANDHITKTLSSRKVDKAMTPTIMVMQRLHHDDPTGHLLKKEGKKIKHICLPAELSKKVSPPELKDKYVDGLLDPVRISREVISEAKTDLGSYGHAGQYQQNPSPEGGGKLKGGWFQVISWQEFEQMPGAKTAVWNFKADTAYTKDTENDPSALLSFAKIGNNIYIRNSTTRHLEFPELIKWIPEYLKAHGGDHRSKIGIEPKASGKSVKQQLKHSTDLNVIEDFNPDTDKVTRVNAISPKVEAGRVTLIDGAWIPSFIEECEAFPNGEHDDKVDTLVMAVNELMKPKPATMAAGYTAA